MTCMWILLACIPAVAAGGLLQGITKAATHLPIVCAAAVFLRPLFYATVRLTLLLVALLLLLLSLLVQGKIKGSYTPEKMLEFCRRGTLSPSQLLLGIDQNLPYLARQVSRAWGVERGMCYGYSHAVG